ncbi:MAG: CRISPR system precrRNA processing endoribonuclease RAMP protein Cas6 [bacterium]|nr:CRISPR system precrRNA processing endoribonuclease RAMP protein Cas6 [bacterium]
MKSVPWFFPIYTYEIYAQMLDPALFPPFKGSTLRGAFGIALKQLLCVERQRADCTGCIVNATCGYKRIFEPESMQADSPADIPTPFVLEPPLDEKTEYAAGDLIQFNCILLGDIVHDLPYIVVAFTQMGKNRIGLKDHRGRFTILKIKSGQRIIYDGKQQVLKNLILPTKLNLHQLTPEPKSITLRFQTPVRIKTEGKLHNELPFTLFAQVLYRRIYLLGKYYYPAILNQMPEYSQYLARAEQVCVSATGLAWYDWKRFSYRQKTVMRLGGLIGDITYTGDLAYFMPWIGLGEKFHIGKNTSFGLGKYQIISHGG